MENLRTLLLTQLLALVLAAQGAAQLTLNDAHASLDVNGVSPSAVDPAHHEIPINVTSVASVDIHVSSGPNGNVGVILLASGEPIDGPQQFMPWGDSMDVGRVDPSGALVDVTVLADGVGFEGNSSIASSATTDGNGDFNLTGPASTGFAGVGDSSVAVQSLVADPTAAPFFLDNTEAGEMEFFVGPLLSSYQFDDDGFVRHDLTIPIDFGGTVYTSVYMNANGFVTFIHGSPASLPTMARLFNGWRPTFPFVPPLPNNDGVAVAWSDLNPFGLTGNQYDTATYDVLEDPETGVVECQFNNQVWWDPATPAGSFKAIFNDVDELGEGGVTLDLSDLTPDPLVDDNILVGVTDGDDSSISGVGTDTDLSNGMNTGFVNAMSEGYVSPPGGPDSVGELFQAHLVGPDGANPPETIHFRHLGGFRWFIN